MSSSGGGSAAGGSWIIKHTDVPICFAVAPIVLMTVLAWRLDTLARRRAKLNLCPKCGYDRTGLAGEAAAKCPECGSSSVDV